MEHDDVKYLNIDVLDMENQNIKKHFDKCFKFIESGRRDGIVLVHCSAGVSRAPTVCIAYLMKKLKLSLDDAMELVKDARPCTSPNPGFLLQLKDYFYDLNPDQKPAPTSVSHVSNPPVETKPAESTIPTQPSSEPQQEEAEGQQTVDPNVVFYTCRVCRYRVFDTNDLVPHESGKHEFAWRRRECVSSCGFLASPMRF